MAIRKVERTLLNSQKICEPTPGLGRSLPACWSGALTRRRGRLRHRRTLTSRSWRRAPPSRPRQPARWAPRRYATPSGAQFQSGHLGLYELFRNNVARVWRARDTAGNDVAVKAYLKERLSPEETIKARLSLSLRRTPPRERSSAPAERRSQLPAPTGRRSRRSSACFGTLRTQTSSRASARSKTSRRSTWSRRAAQGCRAALRPAPRHPPPGEAGA